MVILTTNGLPVYEYFYNVPDLGKIFGVELERIIESKEYNGLYVYVYSYDKIDAAFTAQPMVAEKFDYALSEYGYKQITQHKNAYYSSAYLYGNPDNLDYVIRIVWRVLDGEKEVSIVEIEPTQGMYKNDGSKLTVPISEVQLWENDGWKIDGNVIMYAMDGRTICVKESEVQAYKNVGWYETKAQAQAVNKKNNNMSNSNNPTADGFYYRTPTGKRYHLDPNCGGKNSYRTTNISGLSPCAKCAR